MIGYKLINSLKGPVHLNDESIFFRPLFWMTQKLNWKLPPAPETEDIHVFIQPGGSHLWGFIISYILPQRNYQESLRKI